MSKLDPKRKIFIAVFVALAALVYVRWVGRQPSLLVQQPLLPVQQTTAPLLKPLNIVSPGTYQSVMTTAWSGFAVPVGMSAVVNVYSQVKWRMRYNQNPGTEREVGYGENFYEDHIWFIEYKLDGGQVLSEPVVITVTASPKPMNK
jgi:hypothetical protein